MKYEFYVPEKGGITLPFLQRVIERNFALAGKLNTLNDYYVGKQPITERVSSSSSTPNNKVVVNYCKVIADFFATSLTGKPVDYDADTAAKTKALYKVLDMNMAESEDMAISQNLNIFGRAVEHYYIDSSGKLRFYAEDPRQIVFIRERTPEALPVCVLKIWKYSPDDDFYMVERYEDGKLITYKYIMGTMRLEQVDVKSYNFDAIPFCEIFADEHAQSTFECVLSLQDAYNKLMSLQIDDYEGFVDSFLAIYNAGGTTSEDIAAMKHNRVILLDGESKAEWIVKSGNPAVIEEIKTSIEKNIHKVSMLPDMSDQNFSGNSSGVAIQYKLIGSNSILSKQQRAMSMLIDTRINFIVNYLNTVDGIGLKADNISYSFKSLQLDEDEMNVEMINSLYGKMPIASLVKNLSFSTPEDVKIVKKADEKQFSEQEKTSSTVDLNSTANIEAR